MPFIPHTSDEVKAMLSEIGLDHVDELFSEVPVSLPKAELSKVPNGLSEFEMTQLMQRRAKDTEQGKCFVGAGAYEHFVPAAVWQIVSRGEFYTAYTPYQPEASQGSLQLIYEFQTMMSELMALEVSNASLYDGASALAEAVLMAVRVKRGKAKQVIVPRSLHPAYRKVLTTILPQQDIELIELPFTQQRGTIDLNALEKISVPHLAAVIIPQPNFFGCLEAVDALTNWAHQHNALAIGVVNPVAMALLKPPGQWGEKGVDIACGEGQPLGVPLAGGGPYFGFMCARKEHVRQMPGRIVGRTVDQKGREGFVLTLQAREQHIRRGKATSNICTNQGLMVVAATIHMSLLGYRGLRKVALQSHQNAKQLRGLLAEAEGIIPLFPAPFFHEFVMQCDNRVQQLLGSCSSLGVQAGFSLVEDYPELGESLLVCATETKTIEDLQQFKRVLMQCQDLSCASVIV
jgi:glycine dehydrogenase subunit 1